MSAQLQTTRTAARDALRQLASEGLVIAEPFRRYRITSLHRRAIHHLAQTRVALDMLAVRDIVADPTGRRLRAVEAAWRSFEQTKGVLDAFAHHQRHLSLHRAIWLAADNHVLMQLWPVLEPNLTIAAAPRWEAQPDRARHHREHAELVAAIVSKDLPTIEARVRGHDLGGAAGAIADRSCVRTNTRVL